MARPREFDTDAALTGAMAVFWEHGYADATLPDLLEGMGLTRGSLYKAFKDKKSLFLQVLERYDTQEVGAAVALLSKPTQGGWARVYRLFDSIEAAVHSGDHRGCLLCSAMAGPAAYDTDIETAAGQSLERLREAFERAIADDVSESASHALSDFLVTQYVGLRILARTGVSAPRISQSVAALKALTHHYSRG